jgi:hypothetical protein
VVGELAGGSADPVAAPALKAFAEKVTAYGNACFDCAEFEGTAKDYAPLNAKAGALKAGVCAELAAALARIERLREALAWALPFAETQLVERAVNVYPVNIERIIAAKALLEVRP